MRKTILAVMLLALPLTGCAAVERPGSEYQVGDITGSALELQARYCLESDPHQRAVLLALMYRVRAPIPPRGLCTDLIQEAVDRGLEGVYVDAAEEDRRRFEGYVDDNSSSY